MGLYAPQDYVVYIAILAVIVWVFLKVFEKVRLDWKLVASVSPYVFVGVLIRVLADAGVFEWNQLWSVTPGVYIVTVALASFFLAAGYAMQKYLGVDYSYSPFVSGALITAYLAYLLAPHVDNIETIPLALAMAAGLTLLVYAAIRISRKTLLDKKENYALVFAHMLDAASTYIAFDHYGFYEEHILPNLLISLAGGTAAVMIPAKLIVVLLTIYFIERWYGEEENTEKNRTFYVAVKFLIFILGVGPGLRNTLLPALA